MMFIAFVATVVVVYMIRAALAFEHNSMDELTDFSDQYETYGYDGPSDDLIAERDAVWDAYEDMDDE